MDRSARHILQFTEPYHTTVLEKPVPEPSPGQVRVESLLSAVSPGTERLVYEGKIPAGLSADATIDSLGGSLSYPISYGYSVVGRVDAVGEEVDDSWQGRRVFSFQPHTSCFTASPGELIPLPSSTRVEDAVMIPSFETAVNLLMDGDPMLGERVVIFGQGVVGLLTTALASRHPVEGVYVVDPNADRRSMAKEWGARHTFDSDDGLKELRETMDVRGREAVEASSRNYEGADLVYELSGVPAVLNNALSVTGYDGRVVVGSWYGEKKAQTHLGGRFHRSRIQIISSQVSSIDPELRGRWTKGRRMKLVLDLLDSVQPGDLITAEYPIERAPEVYQSLTQSDQTHVQPVFRYS